MSSQIGVMDAVERHLIETDEKIDHVLDCLEEGTLKEKAHIFSAGQVYDAKAFITELIGRALIDEGQGTGT